MALPISTLLWGSESWTLTEDNIRKLRAFQTKTIRSILNINMHEVQEHRITNESLRQQFCNIPDILQIILKRQLNWIGSIAKMDFTRLPRKLIASWLDETRKVGRPQSTFRNSFARAIRMLIPTSRPTLPLIDWIDIAATKQWDALINKWWKTVTQSDLQTMI
jgi:hypothetical protein